MYTAICMNLEIDSGKKFSISVADALTKALQISKIDAKEFPSYKDEIFCAMKITNLAKAFTRVDPDYAFEKFTSYETNHKRLREEVKFIAKMSMTAKFHMNDKVRWITLAKKYKMDFEVQGLHFKISHNPLNLIFPDIISKYIKTADVVVYGEEQLKKYKNFKKEFRVIGLLAFLPKGEKYGGFAKVLVELHLRFQMDTRFLIGDKSEIFEMCLADCRTCYNSTFVPQQTRLKYVEEMKIKEDDCEKWSKIFDEEFPEHADIHKFFGQIA